MYAYTIGGPAFGGMLLVDGFAAFPRARDRGRHTHHPAVLPVSEVSGRGTSEYHALLCSSRSWQ
jgi:hypothetical protein